MSNPAPVGLRAELSDERIIDVRVNLYARVAADNYFRSNPRLGKKEESPNLYIAHQAWVILKREGEISVDFDQFLEGATPNELHAIDVQAYAIETPEADELGESSSPATPGI